MINLSAVISVCLSFSSCTKFYNETVTLHMELKGFQTSSIVQILKN
jgi:hypothetical protein